MALATEMLLEILTARPMVTRTATMMGTVTHLGWRMEKANWPLETAGGTIMNSFGTNSWTATSRAPARSK